MKKRLLSTTWRIFHEPSVGALLRVFGIAFVLLMGTAISGLAQDAGFPVSGQVTDSDGQSIPGVTVVVKGTGNGTATDSTGSFTITVPDSSAVLIFNYSGYETQEVPVGSQTELNIAMMSNTSGEEVVVIGYGVQKKKDVTGAIATVKSEEINRVVVVDPTQAIQGRAPGVQVVQNSGAPGSPLTVRVRGVGTINNSDPLYVVNGVPVGGIGFLNTNDIESIDILKDASAAAVYGARAANGVVLITTKAGSKRKTTFDFNFLTGVSREWKRYNLVNANQWATLRNEASMADNGVPVYNTDTIGQGTDWQDQIFRKAYMQSYYLGASGGSDKGNYYLSGSYLSQEGVLKNSDYNRFTFNSRADYKLSKRLKVGTFLNTSFFNRTQLYDGDPYTSVIANALTIDPMTSVYSGRGGDSLFASSAPRSSVNNPMAKLTYNTNKYHGFNLTGNWFGEYQIIKGLKAKSSLGLIYDNVVNNAYFGKYYVSNSEQNPESQVVRQLNTGRSIIWENSLNYEKTIAEDHQIGGLFMVGLQDNRSEWFRAQRNNTANNNTTNWYLNSASGTQLASGAAYTSSLFSYLIRVNYSYKNKYMFTANARRDGSSRFTKENRWGTFPSFAAGWNISEESFFEKFTDYVSNMKLRASWGKLGNQNIPGGDYPYTTNISTGYNYTFGSNAAVGSTSLGAGNKNIKWETVTTSNLGLDFGFFRNKLLLSADYFVKRTSDMLLRSKLPGYTGVSTPPYVNAGEVVNKGWEFFAEYRNDIGKFSYKVNGNFTAIRNKVTKLDAPIQEGYFRELQTVNITQQGSSIAQFYGYQTDGIVQTDEEAANLQSAQPGVRPGDFRFKDLNGDGIIDDKDKTILGSPLPKFVYGINGQIAYGGFDFNIFLQGSQGNKIFNGNKYLLEGGIAYSNFSEKMLDRWTGPGTSNDVPRVALSDKNNNRRVSDYYVENGSYLRIKSLQLGYTVPESVANAIRLQKLRVFIMAQNLFTFTKYSGLDPEIGTYTPDPNVVNSYLDLGIDKGGTYPQARTWFFGINASF